MDFEADWSMFCKDTPEIGARDFEVGSVSFKMIRIPELSIHMMETPVTQELYQEVMGENPSFFKDRPQNPVERIEWYETQVFCMKLSQRTGHFFRLPTIKAWTTSIIKNHSSMEENAVPPNDMTAHVKSKVPNPYGLYDLMGNIMEWTNSQYGNSEDFCTVGGTWCHTGRVFYKFEAPNFYMDCLGFRCVMEENSQRNHCSAV